MNDNDDDDDDNNNNNNNNTGVFLSEGTKLGSRAE